MMPATPDSITPCTIIIVDDNRVDRMLIKEAINSYPSVFDLLEFNRSDSFLTWASSATKIKPGLILMDINMPGRNGLETIKTLKKYPSFSQTPIAIISATQDEKEWAAAKDLNVEYLVPKSSDFDIFMNMIHEMLKKRRDHLGVEEITKRGLAQK